MTYFRKKYLALLAMLLTGISHIYAADYCSQTGSYASPNDSCCDDECCDDWWLSGDLLCWTVRQKSDLGNSRIASEIIDNLSFTDIEIHNRDLKFDWNLGFRVGAGYHYPCDDWNAAIYWTHFRDNTHRHRCINFAHWKMHYDTIDAILGYQYFFDPCFSITPFMGVRYARINQKVHHFESAFDAAVDNAVGIEAIDRVEFWGAGPQLGFEAQWSLGCGWSVYANLAGNFLYSDFHIKKEDVAFFEIFSADLHEKTHRRTVQVGLDGGLGFRWDFNCITLQLGLEHHRYFDFDQIDNCGSLDLFGANASLTWHF